MRNIIFVMLLTFGFKNAYTQISGQTPVTVGDVKQYTFSNGTIYSSYQWGANGGSTGSASSNGSVYTVYVTWETAGTGTVTFLNQSYQVVGSMSVTVYPCATPSNPSLTFNISSNTCGDKT